MIKSDSLVSPKKKFSFIITFQISTLFPIPILILQSNQDEFCIDEAFTLTEGSSE